MKIKIYDKFKQKCIIKKNSNYKNKMKFLLYCIRTRDLKKLINANSSRYNASAQINMEKHDYDVYTYYSKMYFPQSTD